MAKIEVIKPGMLSSVQDTGRVQYRYAGVPLGGAFDSVSLCIGNRLLGNADSDAAIEMTLVGGEYRFTSSTIVCLTGATADCSIVTNNSHQKSIEHQQPIMIPAGSVLRVGRFKNGARGYLCVAGGIQSSLILGSRSSLVSLPDAGLGRLLRAGDIMRLVENDSNEFAQEHSCDLHNSFLNDTTPSVLRIVPGAHFELFTKSQQLALSESIFRVSDQSNRAGVRLTESSIPMDLKIRIPSEGTLPGYVQIPPSGEPIVLGVDGPTTGGYPVLACVIEADLHILGQLSIRDQLQFSWIGREEALDVLHQQLAKIQSMKPKFAVDCNLVRFPQHTSSFNIGCDTGEADAGPDRDREMALLPYVTAVSIACGGHAGDIDSMREAVAAAKKNGCFIGAHPSYPDRDGFGRREIAIERTMLEASLRDQLNGFKSVIDELHSSVNFIKAHGALYHAISHDISLALWYWKICTSIFPHAKFVGPLGSSVLNEFKSSGIPTLSEGFCDRVYESDGRLRSRSLPGACISEPEVAAAQALRLIREFKCNLLCVHSDSNNALEILRLINRYKGKPLEHHKITEK